MAAFENGYGLFIGVGADLPATVRDATALNSIFVDPNRAAYSASNVELVTQGLANREGILESLNRLIERVAKNPDATTIIYYSGHGGRIERSSGIHDYFLIPHGYDPEFLTDTAITGAEFTEKLEAVKSKRTLVFLDCCHAGGIPMLKIPDLTFVKTPIIPELLQMLDKGTGRVVVASSYEGEYSYVGSELSVFTECLLEALHGKASIANDGFVRILDTLVYLYDQVPKRAPGPQHPFVKKILDLADNFPMCCYPAIGQTVDTVKPSGMVNSRVRRLHFEINTLQQEWDLRMRKLERIRNALAVETSAAVEFQLEHEVLNEEAKLAELGTRISKLEGSL